MERIYVTQPYLPSLDDFIFYLKQIWESKILTNGGPFHQQLEEALCDYLGVKHISLFTNGTLALVTALQALRITGEVITTPYSFVATAHSLLWSGIKSVFVDIDPMTLNIDPSTIEATQPLYLLYIAMVILDLLDDATIALKTGLSEEIVKSLRV
jgi:dTDP-4-amino-4,6-dideoxygalactose transaminase